MNNTSPRTAPSASRLPAGPPRAALLALLAAAAAPAAARAQAPILPGAQFPVGQQLPVAMAVADMNRDGKPDVVTANTLGFGGSVSVLVSDGQGGLVRLSQEFLISPFVDVAVGHLDDDGLLDAAVAIPDVDRVGVLTGDGAGGFTALQVHPVEGPLSIAIGDLDGAGRDEIVVGSALAAGGHAISILAWDEEEEEFALSGSQGVGSAPRAIELVDLDGDGMLDVVTANHDSDDVSVLLGPTFGSETRFATGPGPIDLTLADVTGDGLLDAITANDLHPSVSVLPGDGAGGFGAAVHLPTAAACDGVGAGDVDGDGQADVLAVSAATRGLSVLPGPIGAVPPAAAPGPLTVGLAPNAVACADLDLDGQTEVLVSDSGGGGAIAVLRGDGAGGLSMRRAVPTAAAPTDVAAADVDGDADTDLIVAHDDAKHLVVLLNDGAGTLAPAAKKVGMGKGARQLVTLDLDGDGVLDVLTLHPDKDRVARRLGVAGGGAKLFGGKKAFKMGERPVAVAVGDLDGDGHLDLVTANADSDDVSVRLEQGEGKALYDQPVHHPAGVRPASVALGDVDEDGQLDAVVSLAGPRALGWMAGDGAGGLGPAQLHPLFNEPGRLELADVDGDGHLDAVMAAALGSLVLVVRGDGRGGFAPAEAFPVDVISPPADVDLVDLDDDGVLDLLTANASSASVSWSKGDGFGGFAPYRRIGTGLAPAAVVAADLDGDGELDLASADHGEDGVSLLFNRAGELLAPWTDLGGGLPGSAGLPRLQPCGPLTPGSTMGVDLSRAHPGPGATLFVGQSVANLPFQGGVLVPWPTYMLPGLPVDATGSLQLELVIDGFPSGFEFVLQYWIEDPVAPFGMSGSNAVHGLVP